MSEAEKPTATSVSPMIDADRQPPATTALLRSPQVLAALGSTAGGIVGLSHFLCLYLGWCVLDEISMTGWTLALGGVLAIWGGLFALYRRIRVGLDPKSPASKITLF